MGGGGVRLGGTSPQLLRFEHLSFLALSCSGILKAFAKFFISGSMALEAF